MVMNLKKLNCDETKKNQIVINLTTKIVMKLKNWNGDETQTQIVMNLKKSNCDKTWKIKWWWN